MEKQDKLPECKTHGKCLEEFLMRLGSLYNKTAVSVYYCKECEEFTYGKKSEKDKYKLAMDIWKEIYLENQIIMKIEVLPNKPYF